MNLAHPLRSTAIVLSFLLAAAASCTNGGLTSNPDGAGGTGGATTSANGGTTTMSSAGMTASAGSTPVVNGGTGGTTGCPTGMNVISDLDQNSEWAYWSTTHDTTAGGTQTPAGAFMPEMSTADLHYSAHTTGNGFKDWGAGIALNMKGAHACLDFSKFGGIKFTAKGPANLTVAAQVPGVLPASAGGTCADNCYDSHKTVVAVDGNFGEHTLYWNQFRQAGWGTPADFQSSQILSLIFSVDATQMPFDFWVDNITFVDAQPVGTGGTTGAGGMTGVGGSPVMHSFSDVVTEAQFNQMFPQKNGFYTYAGLVSAINSKYSAFSAVGDATAQKKEAAAFLANVALETGSLRFIDEQNPQGIYCDSSNATYPCAAGQNYHGRGPLQISWNYNYGAAGKALGADLLNNPGLVGTDASIAWQTALWFWMTSAPSGRTAHTVMVQNAGFGLTIDAINGAVECGGKNTQAVNERVAFYQQFCAALGVDPGGNLTC